MPGALVLAAEGLPGSVVNVAPLGLDGRRIVGIERTPAGTLLGTADLDGASRLRFATGATWLPLLLESLVSPSSVGGVIAPVSALEEGDSSLREIG